MKRIITLALCLVMSLPAVSLGATDDRIFTDEVKDTYSGRKEAGELIKSLNFSDVGDSHWAKEAIARSGSLNMIKGYGTRYNPDKTVTNEEALAFIIRIMGLEDAALTEAKNIQGSVNESDNLKSLWSAGYIRLARNLGIISNVEYTSLIGGERTNPASREKIVYWLVSGLNTAAEGSLDVNAPKQAIYNFSDWESIDVNYAAEIDAASQQGIVKGDAAGRFNPKASLTRAEMAQILRNMDDIYYNIFAIEKKTGTVSGIRDNQQTITGYDSVWRNYYIRTSNGAVEVLQYEMDKNSQGALSNVDGVVFREGKVSGLSGLREGDQIEYLTDKNKNQVLYVQVLKSSLTEKAVEETVLGRLNAVSLEDGTITIMDSKHKNYTYSMMDGIYGKYNAELELLQEEELKNNKTAKAKEKEDETKFIVIDQKKVNIKNLPFGSTVRLHLKNKTVDFIEFVGNTVLIKETRGIVTENNTQFGYLSFIDNNGVEITKNYYADSIKVEKQQYYDLDDEIGYLDEVFESFEYDPRDTDISAIEPGDIVFMRFDENDGDLIVNLSASANYTAVYGKVKQITRGEGISRYLIEYENKQTAWFDAADGIFISKSGKPVNASVIKEGDYGKFLINQAIIAPGYVTESVKEISIEGEQHFISTIVKGTLSGIEPMQKKLIVQNAQTLSKSGWTGYNSLQEFSISGNDIEYYYNNQRISLDYAERFLKRSDGEVYIALENSAFGERIKKVTFRDGRDEILKPDTVISSDGNGTFMTMEGTINTDQGTIVRRHGRLVDSNTILSSDYTIVSLNGGSHAAVVDITDIPDISGLMIARAKILSVDEGKSFKSQSMSILSGNAWIYTPVQREFTIDYNTLYFTENGVSTLQNFVDYTEESVKDRVYNVLYDGTKAVAIYEAPYAKEAVKGTIYAVEGNSIKIKNAKYLDRTTGKWLDVGRVNSTLTVTVSSNTIIGKNNKTISVSDFAVGDDIRAMTNSLPQKIDASSVIQSYIVFVEN